MKKIRRKFNPNLIKAKRTYNTVELAEVYGVHVRTVQSWRKSGMQPLDARSKPYLFYGEEIKRFLKVKSSKGKWKLNIDEFLCFKCRRPMTSDAEKLSFVITEKKLGKDKFQAVIHGECTVCGSALNKFSNNLQVEELISKGFFKGSKKGLIRNTDNPYSADIENKDQENTKTELVLFQTKRTA